MADSQQTIKNVRVGKTITQYSDVPSTKQLTEDADATSIGQTISSSQPSLQIGTYKAVGRWAVVALAAIVLGWLIIWYLS